MENIYNLQSFTTDKILAMIQEWSSWLQDGISFFMAGAIHYWIKSGRMFGAMSMYVGGNEGDWLRIGIN